MNGLDLLAIAEILGISARAYVALAESDPRLFAVQPEIASLVRIKRWLDAGRPAADLARLEYTGADDVRAIICDVIAALPVPVAWHAVEHIVWFEVGSGTAAWAGIMPPVRAPREDVAHVINICGRVPADELRGVIAHEIGHSWTRPIFASVPTHAAIPQREAIATIVMLTASTAGARAAEQHAADADRWVRARVAFELLADRHAEAWGIRPHGPSVLELDRHFRSAYADGAALAAERMRETEAP